MPSEAVLYAIFGVSLVWCVQSNLDRLQKKWKEWRERD